MYAVRSAALASTLVFACPLRAEDIPFVTWNSEAELGYVTTSGNTSTQSINARAKTLNETTHWRNKANIEILHAKDGGTTSAERYATSAKSKYKFDSHQYLFGLVKYESERFSGYDHRVSEIVGYGQRIIANDIIVLDIEAGPGARQSKPDSGSTIHDKLSWLNGDLTWNFSKEASFSEELSTEFATSSTIVATSTSVKSKLNSALAMKVTYGTQHVSDVPAGIKKLDRQSSVTLVYSF